MLSPGWTAVVVNYNGAGFLEACLAALQRTRPAPVEIIVVDNASTDDSLQELHGFPRAIVQAQSRNLGFAGGANAGLATVETDIALLMNPDVEVDPDFGQALLGAFVDDDRLGAVGALLRYPDSNLIQHAGGIIERPLMTTRHVGYGQSLTDAPALPTDVEFVTGGAMGLRMSAFRQIDGFDVAFSPVYYEDVDLSVRLRNAGWAVRIIPNLRAAHHEGVKLSRGDSYYRHLHRNRIRFALKHLSGHEWRTAFVPAEYERLRHELHVPDWDGWQARSGADGIETALRGHEWVDGWDNVGLRQMPPPTALRQQIDLARRLRDLGVERSGHSGRLRTWARSIVPGVKLIEALNVQRAFNHALVDALEEQDRWNREQTALALLIALDTLGQLNASAPESPAQPVTR